MSPFGICSAAATGRSCAVPVAHSLLVVALQAEYHKLQALYEDLKAAKIDEEVALLLEQQNKHVTEHGHKAAQLAEHYKAEVSGWVDGYRTGCCGYKTGCCEADACTMPSWKNCKVWLH